LQPAGIFFGQARDRVLALTRLRAEATRLRRNTAADTVSCLVPPNHSQNLSARGLRRPDG
jgi:hypothetical protein